MKKHLAEYKNLMSVKQSLEKVKKTKFKIIGSIQITFYQTQPVPFLCSPDPDKTLSDLYSCPGFERTIDTESNTFHNLSRLDKN